MLCEVCIREVKGRGLMANWEKSKFLQKEMEFSGSIISVHRIAANPDKLGAIYIYFQTPGASSS